MNNRLMNTPVGDSLVISGDSWSRKQRIDKTQGWSANSVQISNKGGGPRGARGRKGAFVRSDKQAIPRPARGCPPRGICIGGIYISQGHIISPNVSRAGNQRAEMVMPKDDRFFPSPRAGFPNYEELFDQPRECLCQLLLQITSRRTNFCEYL